MNSQLLGNINTLIRLRMLDNFLPDKFVSWGKRYHVLQESSENTIDVACEKVGRFEEEVQICLESEGDMMKKRARMDGKWTTIDYSYKE